LALLAGRKTLTRADLQIIAALGFDIVGQANADWTQVS
jgi:hypothetical protein